MSLKFPARATAVDADGRLTPEFFRALQGLGTAAYSDSGDFATASDISAAIAALGLGDIATHDAAEFATALALAALSATVDTKAGIYRTVSTLSSSAGAVTVDCSATADVYTLTLAENVTSWAFNSLPAAGKSRDIDIRVIQNAASAMTVVSPATSGRTAGGAWAVSATLSSRETLKLRVFSDGTVEMYPSGVMA